MRERTRRLTATTALLLVSCIVLAGCFSVESNFTINDDGTADIELVTLIDTEQLSQFADMFGQDASEFDGLSGEELLQEVTQGDDPCGDLAGSLTDYETSIDEIDNGSELGVSCTVSGIPIEELNTIGADSSFAIDQDETGTRFSAVLEGVDQLTGDSEDVTQLLDVNLDEIFSIVFTVTAPGSLGDNNATSTDGSKATWDITADAAFVTGGDATMTAEWIPGGGADSNTWLILLIVGLLVVAAIVLLVVLMRRRKATDPAVAIPAPSTPSPSTGTVPPPPPSSPPSTSPPPLSPPPPPPPTSPTPPAATPPTSPPTPPPPPPPRT